MEKILSDVITTLIRGYRVIDKPGLFYGKMGIAVFLFHYARFSGDEKYEDLAVELIEGVRHDLKGNISFDYANGLSGIGCGIEYLVQNGFIDVNTDEVLEDIDAVMSRTIVFTEHLDISLYTGLCGAGRYFLFRLSNPTTAINKVKTLTNRTLIIHIVDKIEKSLSYLKEIPFDVLRFLYAVEKINLYPVKVNKLIKQCETLLAVSDVNFNICNSYPAIEQYSNIRTILLDEISIGLYDGYAGMALHYLSELDPAIQTWRSLL